MYKARLKLSVLLYTLWHGKIVLRNNYNFLKHLTKRQAKIVTIDNIHIKGSSGTSQSLKSIYWQCKVVINENYDVLIKCTKQFRFKCKLLHVPMHIEVFGPIACTKIAHMNIRILDYEVYVEVHW